MLRLPLLFTALLLAGCASGPQGVTCRGDLSTLDGKTLGQSTAKVFDLVNAFSVSNDDVTVESGPLHSNDRLRWIPSAVTKEGYYAQRLSSHQFRLINPYQDNQVTWQCP